MSQAKEPSTKAAKARSPSPLEHLQRRGAAGGPFLSDIQIEAGQRLQRDFELSCLRQRLTLDMSQALPGRRAGGVPAELAGVAALDAKRRCLDALDAVGPGLADLLFETVCMEHGLTDSERAFGWPARSAKAILGLALDRLVSHYGLRSGTRRGGRIELWRQADDVSPS